MAGRSTFGNARKLPSGRWQASYWHEGKRHIGSKTFPTKADANAWLSTVESELRRGVWIDPGAGAVRFDAYARAWLEQRHDLADRTRELYQWLLDRHIIPTFGTKAMATVTPASVRSWHAGIAVDHPTTASKAYRLLSTIMRTAVADEVITRNPCQVKGAASERAPERPVASVAEVQALAKAMPDELSIAVLLAAWCQLRRGELLGLRRRDVDPSKGTVTVAVTRTKTMAGTMVEKAPKTDAGRRTLTVPPHVFPALTEHLRAYVGPDPDDLLLSGGYRPLRTAWDNARAKVGRTDLRLHDLRHSGLTWSAATGASVAELMRRAGHKSPTAAMNYQHATEDRDRALADALATLAKPARASKARKAPRRRPSRARKR